MTLIDENFIPESGALLNFGEIGSEELEPKLWIKNDKITALSCGDEFVVIVTESGRAFSYGKNDWGQLGLGDTKMVLNPSCIKGLKAANEKAVLVACGRYHTLISTESQNLFGFGCNNDGQLAMESSVTVACQPTHIKSWTFGKIKQLTAGGAFSAAITENGSLYVWGSNSECQLGLGNLSDEYIYIPTKISFFSTPVSFVACGNYHTAAISQGKLFIWGEAADDKLGGDFPKNQNVPQGIMLKIPVKQVACGHNHTVCLSESGDVYVWGKGDSGQLGLGPHEPDSSYPRLLRIPNLLVKGHGDNIESTEKFVHVSAGESHSVIVSTKGIALAFGDGRHGKLGNIGGASNYSNWMWPRPIAKLNKDLWIESVKCGGCHTVVLVRNRELNEIFDDSSSEYNLSTMDSDNLSYLSENTTTDLNSSSFRARRNRRQKSSVPESNLPTLTRSMPLPNDINEIRKKRKVSILSSKRRLIPNTPDLSNPSNEVEDNISFVQNQTVQGAPNGPPGNSRKSFSQNMEDTDSKNTMDLRNNSIRNRRPSLEEKVDRFSELMDKTYSINQNKDTTNKDLQIGNSSSLREPDKKNDSRVKIEPENGGKKPTESRNPEVANVGCMANCRPNSKLPKEPNKSISKEKSESNTSIKKSSEESKSCTLL